MLDLSALEEHNFSPSRQFAKPDNLPSSLRLFSFALVSFWFLSLLEAVLAYTLHHHWRAFEPMYPPAAGIDIYSFLDRFHFLHTREFFGGFPKRWYYPAPAALAYALFYTLNFGGRQFGYPALLLAAIVPTIFAAYRFAVALERRGVQAVQVRAFVISSTVLAWPIYFSLQRGNLESLIWLVLAAAVWCVRRERWMLAAVLLGFAASFKIYPIIYLGLFLPPKRWKEIGAALATMTVVTLASLSFIAPDLPFTLHRTLHGLAQFSRDYGGVTDPRQAINDHSLFELLKKLLTSNGTHVVAWIGPYTAIVGLLFVALFLLRVIRMPQANQLLFLVAASVFLPPVSFDYTLESLYIPWAWIVLLLVDQPYGLGWWPSAIMLLFAVELAPVNFVVSQGVWLNGVVKGFALLGLVSLAASVRLEPTPSESRPLVTELSRMGRATAMRRSGLR